MHYCSIVSVALAFNFLSSGYNELSLFQINPLEKVPTLVIGDKAINDSHAIALYLCQKNEKQDLYPKDDIVMKARVDEMLFFNATTLFPVNSAIYVSSFT